MAVFPCKLRVMAEHVYTRRDPIVCGVRVEAGVVKTGTPICVPSKEFIFLGVLTGIQHNNKDVDTAKKGDEVTYDTVGLFRLINETLGYLLY